MGNLLLDEPVRRKVTPDVSSNRHPEASAASSKVTTASDTPKFHFEITDAVEKQFGARESSRRQQAELRRASETILRRREFDEELGKLAEGALKREGGRGGLDREALGADLRALIRRFADLPISKEDISREFSGALSNAKAKAEADRPWYKRVGSWIPSATSAVSDAFNKIVAEPFEVAGRVASGLGSLGSKLLDGAQHFGSSALSGIASAAVVGFDFITAKSTWSTIGNGIRSGVTGVVSGIGSGLSAIGYGIVSAASAIGNFAYNVVTDPAKAWGQVCDAASAAKGLLKAGGSLAWSAVKTVCSKAVSAVKGALDFVGAVFTDPARALEMAKNGVSAVLSFGKSLCDAMGLTDLAVGAWNIVAVAPYRMISGAINTAGSFAMNLARLATGRLSPEEFGSRVASSAKAWIGGVADAYAEGARALVGGVILLGELTGVSDAVKAVYYLAKGDFGMAAVHLAGAALSIGAITATVITAGAAAPALVAMTLGRMSVKNAASIVMKSAAKNFLEAAGKGIGESIIKETAGLAPEALKKLGMELAQGQPKHILHEVLGKEGAHALLEVGTSSELRETLIKRLAAGLDETTIREAARKGTSARVAEYLVECGVPQKVEEFVTRSVLKDGHNKSAKKIARELVDSGLIQDEKAALKAAKDIKKCFKLDGRVASKKPFLGDYVEVGGAAEDAIKYNRSVKAWNRSGEEAERKMHGKMCELLTDSISTPIREQIEKHTESAFKKGMQKIFRGEAKDLGSGSIHQALKRQAKDPAHFDELVEKYTKASWEGVQKGIKEGVEKAVREGVESAFKKYFDKSWLRFIPHLGARKSVAISPQKIEGPPEGPDTPTDASAAKVEEAQEGGHDRQIRQVERTVGNRIFRDTYVRYDGAQKWDLENSFAISELVEQATSQENAAKESVQLRLGDRARDHAGADSGPSDSIKLISEVGPARVALREQALADLKAESAADLDAPASYKFPGPNATGSVKGGKAA